MTWPLDPVDHASDFMSDMTEDEAEFLAEQNRADEHLAYLLELDSHELNDRLAATREEERNQ